MAEHAVLVLNRSYLPVNITSVHRAFSLLLLGVAVAVDEDYSTHDFERWVETELDEELHPVIRTVSGPIRIPRVILLVRYDRVPKRHIRFSRTNIFQRDKHMCQYCGQRFSRQKLNIDHVLPRSRGGKTTWDNVVCCCIPCNRKKGDLLPDEAGMKLLKKPKGPASLHAIHFFVPYVIYDEWAPFIYHS